MFLKFFGRSDGRTGYSLIDSKRSKGEVNTDRQQRRAKGKILRVRHEAPVEAIMVCCAMSRVSLARPG